MRKFFTALIVIPLFLIFVVFAASNRHFVTVSFNPFDSTDPSLAVALPLFALIIAVAILGSANGTGGARRAGTRPMRGRRGRNWPICTPAPAPLAPTRSAFPHLRRVPGMGPPGETSTVRRCRTRPVGYPLSRRVHVPACQNLRPFHARDARRGARRWC
jgi:uncharacterized integral membrane protein